MVLLTPLVKILTSASFRTLVDCQLFRAARQKSRQFT
jgi:hypothetical protein